MNKEFARSRTLEFPSATHKVRVDMTRMWDRFKDLSSGNITVDIIFNSIIERIGKACALKHQPYLFPMPRDESIGWPLKW